MDPRDERAGAEVRRRIGLFGLFAFIATRGLSRSRLTTALLILAVAAGVGMQIPNTANLLGYSHTMFEEATTRGFGDARAAGQPMTDAVLASKGVTRRIGQRAVVSDVSLTLVGGESIALVGPSGCGKTSLLQMLGLLDRPDAGVVEVGGVDGWSLPETERARYRLDRMGFMFQHHNLFESMTALENVALPAWRQTGARAEARRRAMDRLELLGLGPASGTRAAELSGGEAQRVALARALINDPAIVLADEPTGSLDSASSRAVIEALFAVCERGAALLVVTHDLALAARAERRLSMLDGRLVPEP